MAKTENENIAYSGTDRFRVYNKCQFSIGVRLLNGTELLIKPGGFQLISMDDILYIESSCATTRFFGQKKLKIVDQRGEEVPLEKLNMVEEETDVHKSDEEILKMLKGSVKQLEAWLSTISDEEELHAIYEVAKSADLTAGKLKAIAERVPERDILS